MSRGRHAKARLGWIRGARLGMVIALALAATSGGGFPARAGSTTAPAFTKSEHITRDHLVNGSDSVTDSRDVTVTVSETQSLRDRQAITVTWAGAHPTGGLVNDHNSAAAALQEYPVVVMQCRGTDSGTAPVDQQVSPETCWTQTPSERFQYSQSGSSFPAYRMDRYADTADRAFTVNEPTPVPSACSDVTAAHWVPFKAVDGTVYPGGLLGCAGLAPEAANSADALQPGNTTYGVADSHGDGSAKFVMQTADTNASLGCSVTVACTLEVIPIIGVSCDAAGTAPSPGGMPVADRPAAASVDAVFQDCSRAGQFAPGDFNGSGQTPDNAVSGELWWSASNWRNRVAVPLTFAPSASVCDVVGNQETAYVYGSESMAQATQQWAPSFCLNASLFTLRHVQTSEPQAKNLLRSGNVEAALEAAPPDVPFTTPVVQAPASVSGWTIAYSVDGADGKPVPDLRLNARLLAKLLSESYRSCALDCLDFTSADAQSSGFAKLATNPIDITRDPEFQALNPGIPPTNYLQSAATLAVMASDSDVMTSVSSYINVDPEARAWLDGAADPWGMVVNPAYKGISLPVANWPLLDTHLVNLSAGANSCLTQNPVPWLPLVAAPVSNPATVALNMQFDIANSQVNCQNNGQQNQKLTGLGRQAPGQRFLLGLVSLGDAVRYQLSTALLQTQRSSTGTGTFADPSGRSFAGPTDDALRAATALMRPVDSVGSWPVPYDTLRTDPAGASAYPGTLLISIDVPTSGLPGADATRYAQLLRFAAGTGQTAGLGNGQLPPGYLPMTTANGLGALAAYTLKAADAVAAQKGIVPFVSGKPNALPPPTVGTGGGGLAGGSGTGSGGDTTPLTASPTTPQGKQPSASPSSVNAARVGKTSSLSSGVLGLALPVLALAALVSLGAAGVTSRLGRRR